MLELNRSSIRLPPHKAAALIAGARNVAPVRGLTHDFYKYPARFSPQFARAAIEALTERGDLVLDNHVGGGTTLVEALAAGRHAVGADISTLAEFVATVKTTIFSEAEFDRLDLWAAHLGDEVHIGRPSVVLTDYAERGYYKHLNHPSRWRLRKAIEQGIAASILLGTPRLEAFGRCVVLRTAQWALDGRAKTPSINQFRDFLQATAAEMIEGARALRRAVPKPRPTVRIVNRSAVGLETDTRIDPLPAPRLVLTSPPYPGVHVLYHRWQVDGRKEAPTPFMIAHKLDGAGSSYYTMGDRKYPALKTYFDNIRGTMSSVARLSDERTVIVQMLAFSDPSWQLDRYLKTMDEAGLEEVLLQELQTERDGRRWRSVPNRRWYSDQRGDTPGSQEVVLFHKLKPHLKPWRLQDHRSGRLQTDPLVQVM